MFSSKLQMNLHVIIAYNFLFYFICTSSAAICHIPQDNNRIDCHPGMNANQTECERRGCCWNDNLAETNPMVPMCYYPVKYSSYKVTKVERMIYGYRYSLEKTSSGWLPEEILSLHVELIYMSASTVRIRILDRFNERFEVPYVHDAPIGIESVEKNLDVHVIENPFAIKITHKITNKVLLDTSLAPLLYSNQFIQFSTSLPSYFLYGLGEHRNPLRLTSSWQRIAFWTRGNPPMLNVNLYGNIPFALFVDDDGHSSGFFLMNANAMDAIIQPAPAITFHTIGGIIDLFVYGGTTPEDVIRQHWEVTGSPYFLPMWTMGFHLSRWGYGTLDNLMKVIQRMNTTNFPYDVQWTDIDAMRRYLVFTYDNENWAGLADLVEEIHTRDMFYVPINDPCIGSKEPTGTYSALDTGLEADIFIKHNDDNLLTANVWPGDCYMPDFTHPNAYEWWKNEIDAFNKTIPFDGIWIDMNEPTSFIDGSINGCPNNSLDNPWYLPVVGGGSLSSRTLCPSSTQHLGKHYDVHSLFGLIESKITMEILQELDPNRRHFVLTRAHYAGIGKWAAHWSGDNFASWDDVYYTIPEIITYNMYGVPFIGPDICGFVFNATEEMCMRWMQLGAFIPFMRNHNAMGFADQDPAIWSEPARESMKMALEIRYRMTPFWYSSYYQASKNTQTVIQPLFYLYPDDEPSRRIDTQFLIGRCVLVSPVLTAGALRHVTYLPIAEDTWYRFPDLTKVSTVNGYHEMDVNQDTVGLFVRPGCIIPMMTINTGMNLRQNIPNADLELYITLSSSKDTAEGMLYWDNGNDLIDTMNTYIRFNVLDNTLSIHKIKADYRNPMVLSKIILAGQFTTNDNVKCTGDNMILDCEISIDGKLEINVNRDINNMHDMMVQWELKQIFQHRRQILKDL